jgi:hypothetical protein
LIQAKASEDRFTDGFDFRDDGSQQWIGRIDIERIVGIGMMDEPLGHVPLKMAFVP